MKGIVDIILGVVVATFRLSINYWQGNVPSSRWQPRGVRSLLMQFTQHEQLCNTTLQFWPHKNLADASASLLRSCQWLDSRGGVCPLAAVAQCLLAVKPDQIKPKQIWKLEMVDYLSFAHCGKEEHRCKWTAFGLQMTSSPYTSSLIRWDLLMRIISHQQIAN